MGVASLVLGIISVLLAFIPFCGTIAFLPALIGLGLAIAEMIVKGKKKLPRGMGIAGLILNVSALIIIVLWLVLFAKSLKDLNQLNNLSVLLLLFLKR